LIRWLLHTRSLAQDGYGQEPLQRGDVAVLNAVVSMAMPEKAVKNAAINLLKRNALALEPTAKCTYEPKLDSDRLARVALVMQALRVIVQEFCEYALP